MAKTLTLKNLSDPLHARLAAAAIDTFKRAGRRLLRSIASLEAGHEQSHGLESCSSQSDARACGWLWTFPSLR